MPATRLARLLLCTSFALAQSFAQSPRALPLSGDIGGTHDPSIMHAGNTWYVFATGKAPGGGQFAVRCSSDLLQWKLCGHVFDEIPAWIHQRSPGTEELWAPDISFVHGEYHLYYAYSLFGRNTSGIALAVNKTLDPASPDFKWIDKGLVLESKAGDNFNAIDPNFALDEKNHAWLSFGSFWDGIKMRRLDDTTGLLSSVDTTLYSLARREKPAHATAAATSAPDATADPAAPAKLALPPDWQAIEAPFIVRHGSFFYLFTSWDLCCRGTRSTYHTTVGRARSITGPYVDEAGKPLAEGGGSVLLDHDAKWLGPGGESILMHGGAKGEDLIVFHAYDATSGKPSMHLSTIDWSGDWPHAALSPN